jgi:predicted dehydrogenase
VREQGPRFLIHGTEGSFIKYGADPQEEALTAGRFPDEPGWGTEPEDKWGILNTTNGGLHYRGQIETIAGCYHQFYNELYETLTSGRVVSVHPGESLNGIRIIMAAYESSLKHIAVDPAKFI